MEDAASRINALEALNDGDHISVSFSPALEEPELGSITQAEGELRRIVGKHFLIAHTLRRTWGMPPCIDLDPKHIDRLTLLKTSTEVREDRARRARGELVFNQTPGTAVEVEEQLTEISELIEATKPNDPHRAEELIRQMDDIADLVGLAKRKRTYLRSRARLGCDFHPWLWPDDRVFRNETVRPLPADFELDPARRKDRATRLEQAVRIFGEAERETRRIASALRAAGYDVRRPHPNAQELRVRVAAGSAKTDFSISCSANGLWEVSPTPPQNKTQARQQKQVLRAGALSSLQVTLSAICAH